MSPSKVLLGRAVLQLRIPHPVSCGQTIAGITIQSKIKIAPHITFLLLCGTLEGNTRNAGSGAAVHTWNPRTWKVEAGKSDVQGYLWLRKNLGASLRFRRFCLKQVKN